MAVIGDPQGVATALAALSERGQRLRVRPLGTRGSASPVLAPPSKGQPYPFSLRLLSTQDCHSAVFFVNPSAECGRRNQALQERYFRVIRKNHYGLPTFLAPIFPFKQEK